MELIKAFADPRVIGPMVGLFAVIGWAAITVSKQFFSHQERMEKIRMGIDPDSKLELD